MLEFLIACSHRRHKTVLSCLVRIGGVNTTADKTRQFCLIRVSSVNTNKLTVANWKLRQDERKLIETWSK